MTPAKVQAWIGDKKQPELEVHDLCSHVHPSLTKERGFVEVTVTVMVTSEYEVDLMRAQPQRPPNYELVGGGEDWKLGRVGTAGGSAAPDA